MENLSLAQKEIPGFSRIEKNVSARKISLCEEIDFFGNDPLDVQGTMGTETGPLDSAVTPGGPERAQTSTDCVHPDM